jgi:hypothetical protein
MKGNLYQHIKIRHAYDFSLCFPHELLMSFELTIMLYIAWNQRCVNNACKKCMLNRSKYSCDKMYKDIIWTKLFYDVLSFPNSCCISSEMSKILFAQYFSPSRTNYKFVTPLSFHQNNHYTHIYWIITFKIIDQSGCKTDQPEARAFFADHPTAEAKSPGYEVVALPLQVAYRTETYQKRF